MRLSGYTTSTVIINQPFFWAWLCYHCSFTILKPHKVSSYGGHYQLSHSPGNCDGSLCKHLTSSSENTRALEPSDWVRLVISQDRLHYHYLFERQSPTFFTPCCISPSLLVILTLFHLSSIYSHSIQFRPSSTSMSTTSKAAKIIPSNGQSRQ